MERNRQSRKCLNEPLCHHSCVCVCKARFRLQARDEKIKEKEGGGGGSWQEAGGWQVQQIPFSPQVEHRKKRFGRNCLGKYQACPPAHRALFLLRTIISQDAEERAEERAESACDRGGVGGERRSGGGEKRNVWRRETSKGPGWSDGGMKVSGSEES